MRVSVSQNHKVIYAMDRMCFPSDTPYNVHSAKWWVVRVDGEFAGYAGAKVLLGQRLVYLCRAGVLPKFRGMGIQKKLINTRVRWAKALDDVDAVITATWTGNIPSANNLIACGFRMYEPQEEWLENALYWRKKIA